MDTNVFSVRLKELRSEKGLGQVELAKDLGLSKGIISLWENAQREPTMNSLIILARYFSVTVDYLIGLEN